MKIDQDFIKVKLDQSRRDNYGELFDLLVSCKAIDTSCTLAKFMDKCVYYARKYFRLKEKLDKEHNELFE